MPRITCAALFVRAYYDASVSVDAGGCVFGLSRTTADIIFQLQPPFWFFAPNVLYKSDRYILILDESSVASSSTQNFIVWTFSITACRMSVFSFFFFFFFFLFFPFLGAIPCYLVPVVDTGPCQARPGHRLGFFSILDIWCRSQMREPLKKIRFANYMIEE